METIATPERVREAYDALRTLGERPSATKILAILGGGSKTTVLAHLRAITESEASSEASNIPLELLSAAAQQMARKLWEEACRVTSASAESRLQSLLSTQANLFKELNSAYAAEEETQRRLQAANERVKELEAELKARDRVEQNLEAIRDFISTRETQKLKPIDQLVQLLADGNPKPKADTLWLMQQLGYTIKQAKTARDHGVKYGYLKEVTSSDGAVLVLLPKGQEKVARASSK